MLCLFFTVFNRMFCFLFLFPLLPYLLISWSRNFKSKSRQFSVILSSCEIQNIYFLQSKLRNSCKYAQPVITAWHRKYDSTVYVFMWWSSVTMKIHFAPTMNKNFPRKPFSWISIFIIFPSQWKMEGNHKRVKRNVKRVCK